VCDQLLVSLQLILFQRIAKQLLSSDNYFVDDNDN